MLKVYTLIGLMMFTVGASAFADANDAHTTCDRQIRYDKLDDGIKARLNAGETVAVSDENTDSQYHLNYIYKLVDLDAELIQAVFSSYGEQTHHLKSLLESTVEEAKGNWARVRYVADTGHWYVPNSHYTMNDYAVKDGASYLMYWNLAHSEGVTRLEYADGYMRTEALGSHAFLTYCNYVIPNIKLSSDQVNREGLEALKNTVDQLTAWVGEVNDDHGKTNEYIERFRRMIGQ